MKNFQFDIPFEVFSKAGEDGKERRIGGIVSTDHLDRQDEVLIQKGLDFSPFLKSGWFNDNHDSSTEGLIGYPQTAELRTLPDGSTGWYVEGYLLKGSERADRIWELANALQKTDRRLGFSVEGSIGERDSENPKTVRKAVVREVAITRCPVNTNTSLNVLAKSLSVGHASPTSAPVVPGEGAALRVESLEGGEDDKKKKKKKRLYRKSDVVGFLKALRPNISEGLSGRIANYAVRWHEVTCEGDSNE